MAGGLFFGIASIIRTTLLPAGLFMWGYGRSYKFLLGFVIPIILIMSAAWYFNGEFSLGNNLTVNFYKAIGQEIVKDPSGDSTAILMYANHFFSHPIDFLRNRILSLWNMWGFWPGPGIYGRGILFKVLIGLRFPLLIGSIFLFLISKNKNKIDGLLIIPVLTITIVHVIFFGDPRFTYAVEPLLIALMVSHFYFLLQKQNKFNNY